MNTLTERSVVVTGADGFIGSHLVERLVTEGAKVRALCQYNSNGSFGWLDALSPATTQLVDVRLGDIRDGGFVADLVEGAEVVFHLAALIAIPFSYLAPESFLETNIRGTFNVLEAARIHRVGKVINTSTSEVYGTPLTTPITVDHALRAQSPYAATKVAADQLCLAYAASFDLNAVVLRPFNTYGPRQSMRAVIPTILAQMLAEVEEIRLGSLHPRRDFTFVADTVDGFVRLASLETTGGEVIQLGTGTAVSIGELVDICREITGSKASVVADDDRVRPDASEVQVLLSDPSGAFESLGWAPSTSLADGLRKTADWIAGSPTWLSAASRYQR